MGMVLASASVVASAERSDERHVVRLALVLASGRPAVLELELPPRSGGRAGPDRGEAWSQLLRTQASKIAACHYAKENPQVPSWYLERRAVLVCREALEQAWRSAETGRGA